MIWNIDPVLLELGPLELRYYGIFFAGALLAAYGMGQQLCKKSGLRVEIFDSLMVYLVIGLVVGARLGHIVFYQLGTYLANPIQILKIWEGGLASHGAAIGVIFAFFLFLWRHKKIRWAAFADIIAVVAAFPIGLVRLGNFFNSEIVGRAWDGPWAVVFERVDSVPRHPSQIYEFLIGVVLLAILYPLWNKKSGDWPDGIFAGILMVLYFSMRFGVEFFKEYPLHENLFNLTTGQLLSLPFVLVGAGLIWRLKLRAKNHS